mgnify:FL=1
MKLIHDEKDFLVKYGLDQEITVIVFAGHLVVVMEVVVDWAVVMAVVV